MKGEIKNIMRESWVRSSEFTPTFGRTKHAFFYCTDTYWWNTWQRFMVFSKHWWQNTGESLYYFRHGQMDDKIVGSTDNDNWLIFILFFCLSRNLKMNPIGENTFETIWRALFLLVTDFSIDPVITIKFFFYWSVWAKRTDCSGWKYIFLSMQ